MPRPHPSMHINTDRQHSSPLGMSHLARAVTRRDPELGRHEVLMPPAVLNCYSDAGFVSRSALLILNHIRRIIAVENDDGSITASGRWAIVGLSGGSTPVSVYQAVNQFIRSEGGDAYEWAKVIWFVVDERYVPIDSEWSNTRMIRETLFKDSLMPEENLIYPDTSLEMEECVADYERQLAYVFEYCRPTLILLGIGSDGHVASWFPPMSHESSFAAYDPYHLVAHTEQDRFPVSDRITLSMHVILSAKEKCFLIKTKEKVDLYKSYLEKNRNKYKIREEPLFQVLRSSNVSVVAYPPVDHDALTALHTTWKENKECLSIIVLGASGDLAVKKTFPALFSLVCSHHLPEDIHIAAYARSPLTVDNLFEKLKPKLEKLANHFALKNPVESERLLENFKMLLSTHRCSSYDSGSDAKSMSDDLMDKFESKYRAGNRILYLALPPDQFSPAVRAMKENAWSQNGWTRVIVEKPFGRDSESSSQLSAELAKYATENEVFRIDHYLGKEMVLNLLVLRFANVFLNPLWCRSYIQAVRITFKETIGTEGRGGYFERYGIIRDVIQNHLLQILALVAMERPVTLGDEDIRDEKVKVLKSTEPVRLEETVIGQYVTSVDGRMKGYREDTGVSSDSLCPTFATCVVRVNNERWSGVPFMLKAGKALEKTSTEIRLQMRPVCVNLFGPEQPLANNELVIRIQPQDAIYLKVMGKKPGLHEGLIETELDLSVLERLGIERVHDAYERLLLDVVKGDKNNFVRSDELRQAWRIFTPLLRELEEKKVEPKFYPAGSTGPQKAYDLIGQYGYVKNEGYTWTKV